MLLEALSIGKVRHVLVRHSEPISRLNSLQAQPAHLCRCSMSLSPTTSADVPMKRRRTSSVSGAHPNGANVALQDSSKSSGSSTTQSGQQNPPVHIPKRGARACTACRKGKNRCEGEVSKGARPLWWLLYSTLKRCGVLRRRWARPPGPGRVLCPSKFYRHRAVDVN